MKLADKILDWAKDRNDFFCIHELCGFFSETNINNLSGSISALTTMGKLTKTDKKTKCKYSDREHSFWIYNKQQQTNTAQPKKRRYGSGELVSTIIDWIKNRKNEPFCVHGVMDGIKYQNLGSVSRTIKVIQDKGIIKTIGKKQCKKANKKHLFYYFESKNKENGSKRPRKYQSMTKTQTDNNKQTQPETINRLAKEAIILFAQWYIEGNWEKGMAKLKQTIEITES